MSRQEQINAQLAAAVPLEQQKAALDIKGLFSTDVNVAALSEDDAILIASAYYKDLEADRRRLSWAGMIVGGVIVIGGMAATRTHDATIPGILIGLAIYFGLYHWQKRKAGEQILGRMVLAGKQKRAAMPATETGSPATLGAPADAFDVPPQSSS